MSKIARLITIYFVMLVFNACTSANITGYYKRNSSALNHIAYTYKTEYRKTPFSILFTDRSFKNVSIEILTDSIRYIYEFAIAEKRMTDTLRKYHLPVRQINELIDAMKAIHCTWIDNLDYYTEGKKNLLVYMSLRSTAFSLPLMDKKYYILTYYSQPQYYDNEGRLLDRKTRKQLRRINDEIFRRINDSVCYTISDIFR